MDPRLKTGAKVAISLVVVLGFAVIWLWLCSEVRQFKPTTTKPKLEVDAVMSSLAGLLSTSVATATAAMLGFEVKTRLQQNQSWWDTLKGMFRRAFTVPGLLTIGCVTYVLVGVLVVVVYLSNRAEAPETMSAFYLSAVGWALGAFSSTFKDPA